MTLPNKHVDLALPLLDDRVQTERAHQAEEPSGRPENKPKNVATAAIRKRRPE